MSQLFRQHFDLATEPFGITPNADFFFGGAQRADVLDALTVTILHDEGIVTVVGEIGMGKTMLARMLLDRVRSMPVDAVYLPNPVFDRDEILRAIVRDLTGELPSGSRTDTLAVLEPLLIKRYAEGRRVVVVIDEAHTMPAPTLEEIRLLSNLETAHHKLLKIIMFGQPELDHLLADHRLRQVRDRVTHRFVLHPLSRDEVAAYLDFRLQRAGYHRGRLFTPEAQTLLAEASGGRTRRINLLADKSLLAAYAAGSNEVIAAHVRQACRDTDAPSVAAAAPTPAPHTVRSSPRGRHWALTACLVVAGVGLGWWFAQPRGLPPSLEADASTNRPTASPLPSTVEPQAPTPSSPAVAVGPTQAAVDPVATVSASAFPPSAEAPSPGASAPNIEGLAAEAATASRSPEPATKVASVSTPGVSGVPDALRRLQAESEALFTGQPGKFTLQLVAMPGPQWEALTAAIQQVSGQLGDKTRVMTNDRLYGGVHYHAIYVGVYDSRMQAQAALQNLPPSLRSQKPMVRQFDRIAEEPRP